MLLIKTELVEYIHEDEQTAGKPYGKAKEVREEDKPVF
jgi:hypothetical protein